MAANRDLSLNTRHGFLDSHLHHSGLTQTCTAPEYRYIRNVGRNSTGPDFPGNSAHE